MLNGLLFFAPAALWYTAAVLFSFGEHLIEVYRATVFNYTTLWSLVLLHCVSFILYSYLTPFGPDGGGEKGGIALKVISYIFNRHDLLGSNIRGEFVFYLEIGGTLFLGGISHGVPVWTTVRSGWTSVCNSHIHY